jgi:hypothetical protein
MVIAAGTMERSGCRGRRNGLFALGGWVCVLGVIWLAVLPWWASRSAMQAHLDWLRARQVDPSAMYYTELEAMKPLLRDLSARQRGK